jgi:uncharacterized protein YjiS (DUF1127 family)
MSSPLINTFKNLHAIFVFKLAGYMQHRKEQAARKRTIHALNSLGQGGLKDLAISRTEVNSIVYGAPEERRRGYSN